MPRRRWRLTNRREQPTPAERAYFETGEVPPIGHPERAAIKFFDGPRLAALWRLHGATIIASYAADQGGRLPWAWERFGAPDAP